MALKFNGTVTIWNAPRKKYVVQEYKNQYGAPYGLVHASTMKKKEIYGRKKWVIDCPLELFFFGKEYDKLNTYGLREGDIMSIKEGYIVLWSKYTSTGRRYVFRVTDFEMYTKWDKKKSDCERLDIPRDPVIVSEGADKQYDGDIPPNLPF